MFQELVGRWRWAWRFLITDLKDKCQVPRYIFRYKSICSDTIALKQPKTQATCSYLMVRCLCDYNPLGSIKWHCHCCSVAQLCLTLCNPMNCSMSDLPVLQYLLKFANGINNNHNEMLVDTELTCQGHCDSVCPLETPQKLSEAGPARIRPLQVGRLPPREWKTQPMKPQEQQNQKSGLTLEHAALKPWAHCQTSPRQPATSRAALYALTQQWQGALGRQREHLSRRPWAFHQDTWGGGCVAHSISKAG